ncbi:MAG: FAD:protein FMN transferase [Bacteroidales bacterium]|jgi:thiamine biosynthesis lipoprotein|nr:FAD:protein FMN transferase [Bacteroidales bacterium]
MKKLLIFNTGLLLMLMSIFMGCQWGVEPIHLKGFAQGTYYSVKYYDRQNRNLQVAIDSLLDDFNKTASIYDETSIISRINRNEDNISLNDDFKQLYAFAMEVSRQTHGAFDITVGQLVNTWGFGNEKRQTITKEKIDSLLYCVGYDKIELKNDKLIKQYPCIKLDFNAIAQGYSVDKIGMFLDALHIDNYLIDIGGEVFAKGNKKGKPWKVGIELPANHKEQHRQVITTVSLHNMALVTSGNYRKYYEENGKRFAHTISPQSGYPVDHGLLSVTVLSRTAAMADAYATAFMVMGMEQSIDFLKTHKDTEAFFIYQKSDSIYTCSTEGFKQLIIE